MLTLNNTRIKVSRDKIEFRVETSGGAPAPFQRNKLNLEFSIARIFHRVLNAYRLSEIEIFEEADFEVLGDSLGKILFENNESDENKKDLNALLRTFRNAFQDPDMRCRIYLEFSPDAGVVAMLPWEYLRLKIEIQDKPTNYVYLAADEDSKFDLIRSFPGVEFFKSPPLVKKLHVIVVKSNCNGPFNVDGAKLDEWCEHLVKNNKDEIVFHRIDQPKDLPGANAAQHPFVNNLKEIIKEFDEPYILHYFGHGLVKNSIGYLSFVSDDDEAAWIEDKRFASFFDNSKIRKPHLVSLQACSTGQIPRYRDKEGNEKDDEIRGVALNLCLKEIPAVVAMQNDITEQDSFAFFDKFYQSLIDGDDVAEAVTKGRTFLGCSYKKTVLPGQNVPIPSYNSNTYGTPALFISTLHPFAFKEKKAEKIMAPASSQYKQCVRCGEVLQDYSGDTHSGGCGGRVFPISEEFAIAQRQIREEKRKTMNSGDEIQNSAVKSATGSVNDDVSNAAARKHR